MLTYKTSTGGDENKRIYVTSVEIADFDKLVEMIERETCDITWIDNLDDRIKKCYESCARETIKMLKQIISEKKELMTGGRNAINEEELRTNFGEYAVSVCALKTLEEVYGHIKLPLTEIIKEKKSGNPGFDFHAYTADNFMIFGESKYNKSGKGRYCALKQVTDFLNEGKPYREVQHLRDFVNLETIDNINRDRYYVAIAYTTNQKGEVESCSNIENSVCYDLLKQSKIIGIYAIAINEDEYF